MSVLSIKERFQERRSSETPEERTHLRSWLVTMSSKFDDGAVIYASGLLPGIGAVHPNDPLARLISREPQAFAGAHFWIVNARYSTKREISEDPLSEPAKISWHTEQFQQVAVQDRSGNAIVNSAGDPFDPPPMADHSRRVAVVTKNLASVPSWVLDYEDAVNADAFVIDGLPVAVGKAKSQRVTISEVKRRNDVDYRELMLEIHLSRRGWPIEPLDHGFRFKDYTGQMKNITNDGDDGLPTAPVLLDGAGGVLADPSPATAVFLSFDYYPALPFSILPLT